MFLENLTLSGFQSFYHPQILSFEPGMTAIVGPPGSGKSSVIQAILWALAHPNAATDPETICSRPSGNLSAKGARVDIDYQLSSSEIDKSISRTLSVNGLWATFKIDGLDYADREPPQGFMASRARVHFINSPDQLELALETPNKGNLFLIDGIDDPSTMLLETLKNLTTSNHQVIAIARSRAMMQIADQVIGVTIEELGVSKIVPMRLRE